ncbi:MAG: hypothetical protein L3J74_11770 [Bacteroidales bacterium]|nr:hypothetical protein [Bacteroidales bacterium]
MQSTIKPEFSIEASGDVSDFVYENAKLYVATMQASIDVIEVSTKKITKQITFKKIKDFQNNEIYPRVYSIDKLPAKNKILAVVQASNGYQNVYLIENDRKIKIRDAFKDRLMIKRAKFINSDTILLGLFSDEIILWSISNNKQIYKKQISTSALSDYTLDKSRKLIITCDESGATYLISAENGKTIVKFDGEIKDRAFSVDYQNLTFISGGKDRNVAVYFLQGRKSYSIKSDFFVLSTALSPSGKLGAYTGNETGDVIVFNIKTKQKLYTLKGQNENISKIYFIDEKTIITSSNNEFIKIWKLN